MLPMRCWHAWIIDLEFFLVWHDEGWVQAKLCSEVGVTEHWNVS